MSKLKVSTRTNGKLEKMDKILDTLKNHPEGLTPKFIAFHTGINPNTVKSIIPQIFQIKKKDNIRGLYYLVDEGQHGNIFSWNVHNCILTYKVPEYAGERITKTFDFGLTNCDLDIGAETKQATLRISTEHPINISALTICFGLFSSLIREYTSVNLELKDVIVSTLEFNQDFQNLRLDGAKCITFDSLIEQYKLYQKQNALRVEYKIKMPITAEVVMSMLNNSTNSLQTAQEIYYLRKGHEVVVKQIKKINALLVALLKRGDSIQKC